MVEVREKVPTGHAGRLGSPVIDQLRGRDVKLELGVYKLRKLRHTPRLATRLKSEVEMFTLFTMRMATLVGLARLPLARSALPAWLWLAWLWLA